MNYSQRPTNVVNYDLKPLVAPSDPLEITDFDYFDRFYAVASKNVLSNPETPNYVELFELKSVNPYLL